MLLGTYREEVRQTKAGFASSGGAGFVMERVIRPISFLFTPLFIRSGATANQVTSLAGVVGTTAVVSVAIGDTLMWAIGASLFLIYILLDAIDGNVARIRNSASYYGKFLDGAVDTFVITAVPFAAGIGAYRTGSDAVWLAVGAGASFSAMQAFYVMTRYSFHRDWLKNDVLEGRADAMDLSHLGTSQPRLRISGGMLLDATSMGLMVSIYPGAREVSLGLIALLLAAWGVLTIRAELLAASANLKVWRRSRHATEQAEATEPPAEQASERLST